MSDSQRCTCINKEGRCRGCRGRQEGPPRWYASKPSLLLIVVTLNNLLQININEQNMNVFAQLNESCRGCCIYPRPKRLVLSAKRNSRIVLAHFSLLYTLSLPHACPAFVRKHRQNTGTPARNVSLLSLSCWAVALGTRWCNAFTILKAR